MTIQGFKDVPRVKTYSDYVYRFAMLLSVTLAGFSNTQTKLHEKISNDYFQYLKKTLNGSTIEPSFRKILLAKLNKLFNEKFFVTQPIALDVARNIIDDIANNDVLLKAEFISPEDIDSFITDLEYGIVEPGSMLTVVPLKLKAGNLPEKRNEASQQSPARIILSQFFDEAMTNFLNKDWDKASYYYHLAIDFVHKTLATEKDYEQICTDLNELIAACSINSGLQALENNKFPEAFMSLGNAYGILIENKSDPLTAENEMWIKDIHEVYLDTAISNADLNPDAIIPLQIAIDTANGKLSLQQLELIRRLVKATYLKVKATLADGCFEAADTDLQYAILKNNDALSQYNYPEEIKADRILRKLLTIMLFNRALKCLPTNRDEALKTFFSALTSSLLQGGNADSIQEKIITTILKKFTLPELQTSLQLIDEFYKTYPSMRNDFNYLKFLFRLKYQIAYLTYEAQDYKTALNLLNNAALYFRHLKKTHRWNDSEHETTQIITACIYRSLALLNLKVEIIFSDDDLQQLISYLDTILNLLFSIPTTQLTIKDELLLDFTKTGLVQSLNSLFEKSNIKNSLGKCIEFVNELLPKSKNITLKVIYLEFLIKASISNGLSFQLGNYFNLASGNFEVAELFSRQLSSLSDQKNIAYLNQIRRLQAECALLQHNSMEGYKSKKLSLLIQANDIYASLDYARLPNKNKKQWENIKKLLANFHSQSSKRIDDVIDLLSTPSLNQNINSFFSPSKKEFSETIKPLILSLRENKSIPHLENVKINIQSYQERHTDKYKKLFTNLNRLINNYVRCEGSLTNGTKQVLQPISAPTRKM